MIKHITEKRVNSCLDTIGSICASPALDQFLIGFTSLSAAKKGDGYRGIKFEHLVLLADQMTCDAAVLLETRLQKEILYGQSKQLKKICRKYHEEKKNHGGIFAGTGGRPHKGPCSVYMVWWDR